MTFPNYAGRADVDDMVTKELTDAGIEPYLMPEFTREDHPEMRTIIVGDLVQWSFKRAWYYWIAQGPGIPPEYANKLHSKFGNDVRVNGHCCGPTPYDQFKGFAVGFYHVDTAEGLKALADTIRKVYTDAEEASANFEVLP